MALDNESFNKQLYDLLKTRGYKPVSKNARNQDVSASQEADVMEFVFTKDGESYGKAWVTIDNASSVVLYYDDEIEDSPDGRTPGVDYDDSWSGFKKHLSNWAQRKQLDFELANKDRLSDDMRQREYVKMKEKISEGYYPMGKQASYNDSVPTVKIILQHNRKIEEGEQRYRNVAKIFLENTEGERILAPTTRPGIAQVYARHLAEGGVPNDERWNHIKGLCEEYNKMAGFVRATRNNQFNESAQALVNEGINHYQSLRESLSKMRGHRGYNAYFESWTPPLMEEENDDSINELFVQETVDPRIESVMPILSRLSKKSGIKPMTEVSELAEWAQSVLEGESKKGIVINGKEVDYASLEIDGVDSSDYPDFSDAYFSAGYFTDGTPMSDEELDQLADTYGELVNSKAFDSLHEGGEDSTTKTLAVPADKMLEAPGAETLGHNQNTEKSNLKAFDLAEEEGRPYICVHAKKGKFECHANSSYEAAKKAAQKWGLKSTAGIDAHLADVKHSTASLGEAELSQEQKLNDALKKIEAKIAAEKNPQQKTILTHKKQEIESALKQLKDQPKATTKPSSNNPLSRLKGDVDDAEKPSSNTDANFWMSLAKLGVGLSEDEELGESRMAETDSIIQDIINGDLDAYDVMANPKTPEEEYVANMMQEMYDDVSIDYHLHPDDDFEKILDIVVDRLEKDHKHDDNQLSMDLEEVDMGQADRTLRYTPRGDDNGKMSHTASLIKAAKKMGHDHYMDVPDEKVEKLKALAKKLRSGEEVEEGLDANQKRVGQLGPTEKVGPKGAVGKLVGASESIERDPLDDLKRLLGN